MSTDPTANAPRPRFSLRTMFFVTTLFAVAAAGYSLGSRDEGEYGVQDAFSAVWCFLTVWLFFTRRYILASVLFVLAVYVFLTPQVGSRPVSSRAICKFNLIEIGHALSLYQENNGALPPAFTVDNQGKRLHSWRSLIAREMGRDDLFAAIDFSKPWNDPANSRFLSMHYNAYTCPRNTQLAKTSYVAVVGPNTAWPGSVGRKLSAIRNPRKTILLIELADSGIPWSEPRDLTVEDLAAADDPSAKPLVLSHHHHANALFADGHVDALPNGIDFKQLLQMCDINQP